MTLFALLKANCFSPQWGNGFLFKLSKTIIQTEIQEVQYKHEIHLSCFEKNMFLFMGRVSVMSVHQIAQLFCYTIHFKLYCSQTAIVCILCFCLLHSGQFCVGR